jgi:hypothetical protein
VQGPAYSLQAGKRIRSTNSDAAAWRSSSQRTVCVADMAKRSVSAVCSHAHTISR